MGSTPCGGKVGLKKGAWTPEEDKKLIAYVTQHGHGNWHSLPARAGLKRCGKSCRLRWINYLKPDIKRGDFSLEEERTIIQLHALLGNKWSTIAAHLPKRTDNEIKNYWNTNIKKRLIKMGIDPITHKPKGNNTTTIEAAYSKDAENLISHMAQWESVRVQAEARSLQLQVAPTRPARLVIGKIPITKTSSISHSLLSTKHNNYAGYNYSMCAIMLATDDDDDDGVDDLQSLVPTLSFPSNAVSANMVGQYFTEKTSLSFSYVAEGDSSNINIIESSGQDEMMKCMDGGHMSNLQDDDIMLAVQAFTARHKVSESIPLKD